MPTAKEAGLPEFQVLSWVALFAPKATPKPILDELTNALDKAFDDRNVRKWFFDLIFEIPDKASRGRQPLAALVKGHRSLDVDYQAGEHQAGMKPPASFGRFGSSSAVARHPQ